MCNETLLVMTVRPGKKFGFQSAAENLQRRRRPDWLRQTVPDRCSSKQNKVKICSIGMYFYEILCKGGKLPKKQNPVQDQNWWFVNPDPDRIQPNTKSNSAFRASTVSKLSSSLTGWVKMRCIHLHQVLRDSIWQTMFHSSEMISYKKLYTYITFFNSNQDYRLCILNKTKGSRCRYKIIAQDELWNTSRTSWRITSRSDCPIAGSMTIFWTFWITFFTAAISFGCISPTISLLVFASSSRFWISPTITFHQSCNTR